MFALTPRCDFIYVVSRNAVFSCQFPGRCKIDVLRSDVFNSDSRQARRSGLVDILKIRHLLHVCRSTTRPHFTKVMKLNAIRYLTNLLFVHETMRATLLAIHCPHSISVFVNKPLPNPAWRFKSTILFNVVNWRQAPTMTTNPSAWLSFEQPQRALGGFCNLCRLAAATTTKSKGNLGVVMGESGIRESTRTRAKHRSALLFKLFHGTMGSERFPACLANRFDVRHLNSLLGKGISERVGTVRETVRRIASYTIPSPLHCIPNYTRSDVLILGGS